MLKVWNKQDSLILPNGKVCTPEEVYQDYPWARFAETVIIGINGGITSSIDNLSILCDAHDVVELESGEDTLLAIKNKIENDKLKALEPTAEERIASAMEFQNLMSL